MSRSGEGAEGEEGAEKMPALGAEPLWAIANVESSTCVQGGKGGMGRGSSGGSRGGRTTGGK